MNEKEKFLKAIDNFYDGLSVSVSKPRIGISGNFNVSSGLCTLAEAYYKSIEKAGAIPVIIPPVADVSGIDSLLEALDGIVLSGGADIDPIFMDSLPGKNVCVNPARDLPEMLLVRLAMDRRMPILGICRGIQILTVALGGKLYQDIKSEYKSDALEHSQKSERYMTSHSVNLEPDSLLASLYGCQRMEVNSFHHQAVCEVPKGFKVVAHSDDGLIEAMESTEYRQVIGVQWHPECMIMNSDLSMMPIFDWLVAQCSIYRDVRRMHCSFLTLDSHCDTPMLFDEGVHFFSRNERALVDLPKMHQGFLDASFMVAYIKQEARDDVSLLKATAKADRLLDLIESRIAECNGKASVVRNAEALYENKRHNIKSIVMGIENGYAIGRDLRNIERFRRRGVAYMTLCHNGDNDLCDSAKGNSEHNGLSELGYDAVAEMNRVGMMVDLSHASEKSFYDAVRVSKAPIICSHSSSRAMCDHPRNLTDDQLRILASTGGVVQVCMYDGFINSNGLATIEDAVLHVMHIIEVAGIDHVGIGTDMDGGGGLVGLEDVTALPDLTARFVAQGLTESDIEKIWGANFIRVWEKVVAQSTLLLPWTSSCCSS